MCYIAVHCYGTEDRVKEADRIVPGNSIVLTFVTFPGSDIKDLYVHEAPAATPPPAPAPAPKSATPVTAVSADVPPPAVHKKPSHSNPKPAPSHNKTVPPAHAPAPVTHAAAPVASSTDKPAASRGPRHESSAGTGSHLLRMKERKGVNDGVAPEGTEGEFDFTQGLKVFKKEELANLAEGSDVKAKYVKDNFFDNLTNDKGEGRGGRLSAAEERHLNQDTFGAIALQNNRRGGGRGRGRGGGRGSGGRGRGGSGRGRGGSFANKV